MEDASLLLLPTAAAAAEGDTASLKERMEIGAAIVKRAEGSTRLERSRP
jgi:hypothetical protein